MSSSGNALPVRVLSHTNAQVCQPWPLYDTQALRLQEQHSAAALPPHTLMQRAGLASARLALALAPHAQRFWVACGPGNNGGDGQPPAR